jgi:hypothetical protein
VETCVLTTPPSVARHLPREVQDLLGYAINDGVRGIGGVLGLYENGDPHRALE